MIRLFVVVLLAVAVTSQNVPGIRLKSLARTTTTTTTLTTCGSGLRFACADCTTQIVCDHSSLVIGTVKCSTSAPYCTNGQCGATPNATCATGAANSNLCPGTAGYYPNPTSCNRFNYCDDSNVATEYICPSNLVFDPVNGGCKTRSTAADCPTVNCYWNPNKYLPYPLNKSLYWFCSATNTIALFQCPAAADGEGNEEFDSDAQGCSNDVCKSAGIFPDTSDETKYYYCVLTATAGVYDKYIRSCGSGLVYVDKRCAARTTTTTTIAGLASG